jgi:sRNA-binding protein
MGSFQWPLKSLPRREIIGRTWCSHRCDMSPTRKRVEQGRAALNFLRQQYPHAFCSPPRPLARNTTGTLLERHTDNLGRRAIFAAVRIWTNWTHYQTALVPGAIRYDLDGNPAGIVSEEEVTATKTKLEEANRRRKERWRCFHERKAHSHIS